MDHPPGGYLGKEYLGDPQRRAMQLRQLFLPAMAAIGCALGCGSPTAPDVGSVRPGLYVLAPGGQQPPLLITTRLMYGDTLTLMEAIDFDSIRILDDSTFQRHYALRQYRQRSGGAVTPTDVVGEVNGAGTVLPRDDHVLLQLLPVVFTLPRPDVFSVRPGGLLRRVLIAGYQCTALDCTNVSNQFADALYTRR